LKLPRFYLIPTKNYRSLETTDSGNWQFIAEYRVTQNIFCNTWRQTTFQLTSCFVSLKRFVFITFIFSPDLIPIVVTETSNRPRSAFYLSLIGVNLSLGGLVGLIFGFKPVRASSMCIKKLAERCSESSSSRFSWHLSRLSVPLRTRTKCAAVHCYLLTSATWERAGIFHLRKSFARCWSRNIYAPSGNPSRKTVCFFVTCTMSMVSFLKHVDKNLTWLYNPRRLLLHNCTKLWNNGNYIYRFNQFKEQICRSCS